MGGWERDRGEGKRRHVDILMKISHMVSLHPWSRYWKYNGHIASHTVQRFVSCVERIDEQQTTKSECGQNSVTVTRNKTATGQAVCERVTTLLGTWVSFRLQPRRHYWQPVKHVRPRFITLSGVLFPCVNSGRSDHHWLLIQQRRLSMRSSAAVYDGLLKKLQAVQNVAARVTTESTKFDHIRLVLHAWTPLASIS